MFVDLDWIRRNTFEKYIYNLVTFVLNTNMNNVISASQS